MSLIDRCIRNTLFGFCKGKPTEKCHLPCEKYVKWSELKKESPELNRLAQEKQAARKAARR